MMGKFTALQMKCLLIWLELPERSRTITILSMKTGVSRTAARNALSEVAAQGILDSEYRLTPKGVPIADEYRRTYQMLVSWMKLHRVKEDEWDGIYTLMTGMGPEFLRAMTEESLLCSICREAAKAGVKNLDGIDLADYLSEGKYEVSVTFTKIGNGQERSMANFAFEKPAYLVVGKKASEIVLKRRRIVRFSPEKHREVSGMMRTMLYETDGKTNTVRAEGDLVRIPTRAVHWNCSEERHELTGCLEMGFTCTAGFHTGKYNQAVMHVDILKRR